MGRISPEFRGKDGMDTVREASHGMAHTMPTVLWPAGMKGDSRRAFDG